MLQMAEQRLSNSQVQDSNQVLSSRKATLQLQVSIRMDPDQLHLMVNLPRLPMVHHLALAIKIRPQVLAPLQGGMDGAVGVTSSSSQQDNTAPLQGAVGMAQAEGWVSMGPQQGVGALTVSQLQTTELATLL